MTTKSFFKALLVAAMLLNINIVTAQTDFERDWDKVDQLLQKKSYNTSRDEAAKLFTKARKANNSRQTLTAAYYLERIDSYYREDWRDSALERYGTILPILDTVDRAVCHALMGNDTLALNDYEQLQKVDIHDYKRFCDTSVADRLLTPTLYDLLALWAVDRAESDRALMLLEQLSDFHKADTDYIRIWLDKRWIECLENAPNRDVTIGMLESCIEKYRGSKCPLAAWFYLRIGQKLAGADRKVEAVRWYSEAIRLYPGSYWASMCYNHRRGIIMPRISLDHKTIIVPNREDIITAHYWNLDTLWFRVIKKVDSKHVDDTNYIVKQKVLRSWCQPVVRDTAYRARSVQTYMPALPDGQYMIIASPSEKLSDSGFMLSSFKVSDLQFIASGNEGYLLRRGSGKPIEGAQLSLFRIKYNRGNRDSVLVGKAVTDRTGHFAIKTDDESFNEYHYTVVYDGHKEYVKDPRYCKYDSKKMRLSLDVFVDRPVYRPGDTLNFSCFLFNTDRVSSGEAVGGRELKVVLRDINYREIDSMRLTTDEFGMAAGSFVIPDDGINGMMTLYVNDVTQGKVNQTKWVRVEEYKQPKFTVQLHRGQSDGTAVTTPRFGEEYKVDGIAAAYSGVPVSGAEVTYRVTRATSVWRGWWYPVRKPEVVASGSVTTDAEGRFTVTFVPEPDSSVELSGKPTFSYEVMVDVTDLNGETHDATTRVTIGFVNSLLSLNLNDSEKSLREVAYSYTDLNGNAMRGDVKLMVERLELPVLARQETPFLSDETVKPLSRDEFHKRFPMFAYDKAEYEGDSVGREVFAATMQASATADNRFILPDLPSGRYRLSLTAVDAQGDTVETKKELILMKDDSKKVYVKELFWYDISKNRAKPGDTVEIKFGTRFNGLTVTMVAKSADRTILTRQLTLSDEIVSVAIPVTKDMVGGFRIEFFGMLNNELVFCGGFVNVEPADKQLDVVFESFRDKLAPGETETWRLKINGLDKLQVANLTMTMYDAALNVYGGIDWRTDMWNQQNVSPWQIRSLGHISFRSYWKSKYIDVDYDYELSQWTLHENLYQRYRMYKGMSVRSFNSVADVAVVEEEEYEMALSDNFAQSATMLKSVEIVEAGGVDGTAGVAEEPVQVRSNLGTLAFFEPRLRTDEQGRAEFTFTVPELLTKWQLHGFAVSQDLKSVKFVKELVTQKELMVQPNVPRFLRFGDNASFLAKVVNMADETKTVEVRFSLSGLDEAVQTVDVPARGSASVTFGFVVPDDKYVVEYQIVAVGGRCSDGERGEIPVLTNRVAVTRSESVYLNGNSTKTVPISRLTGAVMTKSHKPISLTVEFTPNPVWQALKALPFVEECSSPSVIFMANSLYVNSMAQSIVDENPLIVDVIRQWQADSMALMSPLARNESVKQTVLASTPWLRAAEGEVAQFRSLANFLDGKRLDRTIDEMSRKLTESQRTDGAWSWIPDGQYASEYVTSYIVTIVGSMGAEVAGSSLWKAAEKGLSWLDREEQTYYAKYIKPYIKKKKLHCEPMNISWLYARSFYSSKKETEAYKFYYANALKNYSKVENLYSLAQLALVFQRHGDSKAARDVVRMLKERSLTNDEMGMYWRDNLGGICWYQRPVETQSLLIKAFREVASDDTISVALMQQWLLKQKQTTRWGTDVATVSAIDALLADTKLTDEPGGRVVSGAWKSEGGEAGTGYVSKTWISNDIPASGDSIVFEKTTDGIAWGAAYYQYEDDMQNVPSSETGVKLTKTILKINADESLTPVRETALRVGDRLRVKIDIAVDRTLEFVELVDGRASCMEPLSTLSGWRWGYGGGLSYYLSVGNSDMRFYIDRVAKGKYSVWYDVYVTAPGVYVTGLTTWQCLYAPEFRAVAPAVEMKIGK